MNGRGAGPSGRSVALCASLVVASCAASGGASDGERKALDDVHGQIASRYRYRAVDGEDDHDVTSTVNVDVGDPERDPWTGHALGWLSWDADGGGGDAFSDITDTYDGNVTTRLYAAYADAHEVDELQTLRLGRQELAETPVFLTFDGVRAESVPLGDDKVELEAYGGVPAHFFESSSSGDLVGGVAATAKPWSGGRMRFDWMHLEDESLLGDLANDLLGLSVWHRFSERLRLDGRTTLLEGDGRDLAVNGTWSDPESTLLLQATYKVLFNPQQELVQELDPFTATLLTLEPYQRASILASKEVDEDLRVSAGYDVRSLTDAEDEGEFNRDYGRVHAGATLIDVLDLDADLTLTGERWDATGSDTTTWGADLTRRWTEEIESALGSYFAAYRYDFLLAEEHEDVRVYYAGLEWRRTKAQSFEVRYEYENGPLDDYHLVKVGMRWRF